MTNLVKLTLSPRIPPTNLIGPEWLGRIQAPELIQLELTRLDCDADGGRSLVSLLARSPHMLLLSLRRMILPSALSFARAWPRSLKTPELSVTRNQPAILFAFPAALVSLTFLHLTGFETLSADDNAALGRLPGLARFEHAWEGDWPEELEAAILHGDAGGQGRYPVPGE